MLEYEPAPSLVPPARSPPVLVLVLAPELVLEPEPVLVLEHGLEPAPVASSSTSIALSP